MNHRNPHKIDLLIVTPTLEGGVGRVVLNLAKGFKDLGLRLEILTLQKGKAVPLTLFNNLTVKYLDRGRVSNSLFLIRQHIKCVAPTHVLSLCFHMNIATMIASVGLRETRFHVSEHISIKTTLSSFSFFKRWLFKFLISFFYRRADSAIGVSKGVADELSELVHFKANTLTSIYNPVITDELFDKALEPCPHPWLVGDFKVILGIGRLTFQKDFFTLIRAFHLSQKPTNARLVILGCGEGHDALVQLTKGLQIEDLVDFPGQVLNPYAYLKRAKLFILSSRYEGLPTVLIEALALGVFVISTDCLTGPREILENGKFGALVPVGDEIELSKEITKFFAGKRLDTFDQESLEKFSAEVVALRYWTFMNRSLN